jgi:hypothetical protein
MLGEDDDVDEKQNEDLVESLEREVQHKEEMPESSNEINESLDFQTNYLFEHVFAGFEEVEDG